MLHETLLRRCLLALCLITLSWASPLAAHQPLEMTLEGQASDRMVQFQVTLGVDAARTLLEATGYSEQEVSEATREISPDYTVAHGPGLATHLLQLRCNGETVAPSRLISKSGGLEIYFMLEYPCENPQNLAGYVSLYEAIPGLRQGVMTFYGGPDDILRASVVSAQKPDFTVSLPPRVAGTAVPAAEDSVASDTGPPAAPTESRPSNRFAFGEFFVLGIEHILIGIDHLLFLAALLLGVRNLKSMLVIISCFTVAHSITLALAALNLVNIPSTVVEPLIAASIIFVGVDTLVRKEHPQDRMWLAAAFGLIHGFGFASVLREIGLGNSPEVLVSCLLAFNLGVEAGQVMVAALVLPILMWARRQELWTRRGIPAVTCIIIAVSSYWVVERLA